jgi:hypothetical protein
MQHKTESLFKAATKPSVAAVVSFVLHLLRFVPVARGLQPDAQLLKPETASKTKQKQRHLGIRVNVTKNDCVSGARGSALAAANAGSAAALAKCCAF